MGNRVTDILRSKLIPTDALIFYKPNIEITESCSFVEHRKIENGKMGAGSPLEVKTMAKIMKTVDSYVHKHTSLVTIHGRIPEGLLYASTNLDSYRLVWYRKPEKRMMYFRKDLEIQDGYMMVPGLVYSTDGQKLSIYAFKGSKPKKVLYNAPFLNVSNYVCLGDAKVRKPMEHTYENWIDYWETMFWKSEFSHILGDNPVKGNLALITKECIKTGCQFPQNELVRSKVTLQSLMKI